MQLCMVKERLTEVLHENNGLAEQVNKENELKCLQSEIERLEKRLQEQAIDMGVR